MSVHALPHPPQAQWSLLVSLDHDLAMIIPMGHQMYVGYNLLAPFSPSLNSPSSRGSLSPIMLELAHSLLS